MTSIIVGFARSKLDYFDYFIYFIFLRRVNNTQPIVLLKLLQRERAHHVKVKYFLNYRFMNSWFALISIILFLLSW